jgi:hypothetical protein
MNFGDKMNIIITQYNDYSLISLTSLLSDMKAVWSAGNSSESSLKLIAQTLSVCKFYTIHILEICCPSYLKSKVKHQMIIIKQK